LDKTNNLNVKLPLIFLLSFGILVFASFLAITKGAVKIPLSEFFSEQYRAIIFLRFWRVFLAFIVGAGLAVSGVVLQALLRNPLAEPYLLGTSGGAGLAAVVGVGLGVSYLWLPGIAFLGAIGAVSLVYLIAQHQNRISQQSLILSGVIISVFLSAIIVAIITLSPDEVMHGLSWWLWGSLRLYHPGLIVFVSAITFICIFILYGFSHELNALSLGEEEALHLGVDIEKVKKALFLLTSLITAAIVSVSGVIGFVGLLIPHATRLIIGSNHKILIPLSVMTAASFMIICDLLARTVVAPIEIPIGVITALLGAPLFITLLKKTNKNVK
jgi:iron complex transport system permease protein